MGDTSIEWCDKTWNPIRGCSRVSEGCRNCYAERVAARFSGAGLAYEGLARRAANGEARWTGEVRFVEEHLLDPLRRRKPQRIFVNSMSDLFHESVPDEWIDRVHGVMAITQYIGRCRRRECDHDSWACWDNAAPPVSHTYQILTKRAERMRDYYSTSDRVERVRNAARTIGWAFEEHALRDMRWPLPCVWLGVSVEDQNTADDRVSLLLHTPAAVRFVSYEPALGAVEFWRIKDGSWYDREGADLYNALSGTAYWRNGDHGLGGGPRLDWIIVGGESGHEARACNIAWIRSVVEQCREAQVPVFVKQLGAFVVDRNDAGFDGCEIWSWPDQRADGQCWEDNLEEDISGFRQQYQGAPVRVQLSDRKGGNPIEWPPDLRIREFPS